MGNTAQYRRRRARNRRFADKAAFHGINWAHYDHHELYDMIWDAKPEVMRHHAEQWQALGKEIGETTKGVKATMGRLLDTWKGSASTSAMEANARLEHWADEAATATSRIGEGLITYSEAVGAAQRAMPPPEFAYAEQNFMAGKDFKLTEGASQAIELDRLLDDQKPNFEKHQAAHAEAVRVMTVYGGQSQVVHDDMPPLPPSLPPRQQPPVEGPPHVDPPPPPPPWPPPDWPDGRQPDPGDGSDGTGGGSGGTGGSDGTTTPSFADPTTGPGSGPGSEGSRTGVGPGFSGSGPGSGADSTRSGPGFGSGVGVGGGGAVPGGPGRGGAAGVGPLAARGGGGAAGLAGARGGAGGPGGLYPPVAGQGAQGEEDTEHKNKYGEGLDLLDDLPPAYPPVFGA